MYAPARLRTISLSNRCLKAREVADRVLNLPAFEEATRISVYLSMPEGEISTANIVKQALRNGKKVFVPYIQKSSKSTRSRTRMEMLALRSQEDLESLQPDAWGIPTFEKSSLQDRENALGGLGISKEDDLGKKEVFEGLDLILLPGMAFDQSGGRLGHGKGFYDRFLQSYGELASRNDTHAKMPRLGTESIAPIFSVS
jgi:5-formyltetrahydrofolate cyclo-ligase